MNLYVRYFDHETLATSVDEALDFLSTIQEIKLDGNTAERINAFLHSSNTYPFRLKVSFSNYVLFLKTEAQTLAEFKKLEQLRKEQKVDVRPTLMADRKRSVLDYLNEEHPGWYEATLVFKRVVQIRETSKFQYKDTRFSVRLKAKSGMDCYNRIVNHLRNRQDVDPRSQFPSAKSSNFEFKFVSGFNEDNYAAAPINEDNNSAPQENYEAANE